MAEWNFDPRDNISIGLTNSDTDLHKSADLSPVERTGDPYNDKKKSEYRFQLQQASARGLISPNEAVTAWEQDDRGVIARSLEAVTGIEATESGLQTFVDVLSLGNYATAAFTKARHEAIRAASTERYDGEEVPFWDPVRWLPAVSPASVMQNFRDRTLFADVFGEEYSLTAGGIGSFVLDVALDPTTYLTFGTGAGAKIALKAGSRSAIKVLGVEAAKEASELTMTRWGARVHKEAIREMLPKIEKEIADEVAEGSTLAATRQRLLLNDNAAEYMVDNYHRLAQQAWEGDKRIAQRARRGVAGLVEKNPVPLMESMFAETVPLHLRELGVNGAGIRRILEGIPHDKWFGDYFHKGMKVFNKTWGMDDSSRQLFSVMQDTIGDQRRMWTRKIAEEFKGLTDDEAKTVTRFLESKIDKTARNSADILDMDYSPTVLAAAAKAKSIFDDIAMEEQKYRILGDSIDNYVTHLFNGDDSKIGMFLKIRDEKGWSTQGNPYSIHRQIASISDLKGLMPDEVLEENIYKILMRRKIMSINMVNRQKFYLEMQATHGIAAGLIAKAGESVPAAIRKRMLETRDSIADISNVRQWFAHEGISTAKWGFREGDNKQNINVLEWLATDRTARGVDAGWMTDHLRNFTQKIKSTFTGKLNQESYEVNAIKTIRGIMSGDPFDQVPLTQAIKALKGFDAELRKANIGPLLGLVPELEGMMRAGLRNPAKPPQKFLKLISGLKEPVKGLTKEAQLPEDFVIRAIQYRKSMGILTDVTKPGKYVMDNITEMLGGVGKRGFRFRPKETEQLLEVMFDKKTLGSLNAAEADRLQNFLSLHHGDPLARANYAKLTGEPMVMVKFKDPLGDVSFVKTNLDRVVGGFKETVENIKSKSGELDKVLRGYTSKAANLRKKKKEIQALDKGIRKHIDARKGMTKNTPEYLKSLKASNDLKESRDVLVVKYGRVSQIDKEISKVEKLRAPHAKKVTQRAKEIRILKKRKSVAKNHDAYLKHSSDANKKKYEKSLKELRKMTDEVTAESGVEVVRKARKFEPGDPRLTEDLARPVTETIGEGLEVTRKEGTFGPFVSEPGERILSTDSAAYYLPKSIAGLIEDVNKNLYGAEMGKLARYYDALQNMFKAPLMAVWPEFYMRNSVTNVALTYLKCGVGLINHKYQANFLKVLTYTLSKEAIDITNLPKSQAAFMAYAGGMAGGIIGAGQQAFDPEAGALDVIGGALGGAAVGAGGGALIGGATGMAMRGGLQNIARGGVTAQTVAGGTAGALAAGEGNRTEGFVSGAVIGGGASRLALGDGYRNLEKLSKQKIKLANGKELTVAEMVHEAGRRGVFSTHVNEEIFRQGGSKALAMGERVGLKPKEGWLNALKPANAVFARDSFRAGELASEIPTRLMLFTIEAQRTGSLGMAARAVKDYLFDYANLSMTERRVIKRMMPFYTWTKHAMLTSADSIIQNPGRVAHTYKFIHNQNRHQDVDPSDYPDWLVDRLKRVKVMYNPKTKEKEIEVKSGYGFVQEDTMGLWKEVTGGDFKFLSRGPFGVVAAAEWAFDRDVYRGTHIKSKLYERSSYESGRSFKDAPPWMQEAVGYRFDPNTGRAKVDPRAAWLLTEVPVGRFFTVARKVYNAEEQDYNYFALARQVLGEKVYKYGPEQKLYHDKAKLDRMAMFLKNIGQIKTRQTAQPVSPRKKHRTTASLLYR